MTFTLTRSTSRCSGPGVGRLPLALACLAFLMTFAIRVRGVSTHFWLLGDQIRDWGIALRPFHELPLIGPPTHVHGYTIGPAFYWMLWGIRVVLGPFFHNLPHAGGIGQAFIQSGADALLLIAVWRKTGSVWIALALVVLLTTASYDLALSALVWNPVAGSTIAKFATALVLLGWYDRPWRVALTAAVAWAAVHAYTGAVFVAVGVFTAMIVDPFACGNGGSRRRCLWIIAGVVAALQVPYLIYQISTGFRESAMAAVTGSVARIASGSDSPEVAQSMRGYFQAFGSLLMTPWPNGALPAWLLSTAAIIVTIRFRKDPPLLAITLVPQLAAIAGFAFFLGALDNYYYLSLMPAAMLTLLLGAASVPSRRIADGLSISLLIAALLVAPARVRAAATIHKLPQYGAIVDASSSMVRVGRPLRAIRTDFVLPPTADPEFLYRILGGRFDPSSPWIGIIEPDGRAQYRRVQGS